jgi:molybdopterin-containing oxidoreductase family membrane subunit
MVAAREPVAGEGHASPQHKFDFDIEPILAPLRGTGWRFATAILILAAITAWGVYAFIYQLQHGLASTGMGRPAYWGAYMVTFVFFIGTSLAGTLISAIFRLVRAEWRRPVTRIAEVITALALLFGAALIVMDMGRPDRVLNVLRFGRAQSPILWDVVSLNTYLGASLTYLYLPLIPDLAILRDMKVGWTPLYRILALGYTGTHLQHERLEKAVSVMAVLIVPIGFSIHTVTAFIFATTLQPGWHSTILGPYFIVAALATGLAVLLLFMAGMRKAMGLQKILKDVHFNNLGFMLLAMMLLVIYFTINVYLVEITGNEPVVMQPVLDEVQGRFAMAFWGMIVIGFILPCIILAFPKGRTVTGCVIASLFVIVAMWLERYMIIAPTLGNPRLPWAHMPYQPTWVEVSVSVGCVSGFIMLFMLFLRIFPIISLWEMQEGIDTSVEDVSARFRSYMPGASALATKH